MTFDYVICYFLYLMMVVTFIISLIFCFKKYNPSYLRFFPFYHLAACVTEGIVCLYFSDKISYSKMTSNIPYNLFTSLEFIFFTYFIYRQLTQKKNKIVLCGLASIAILIILLLIFQYHTLNYSTLKYATPLILFYIVGGLLYLYDIFSDLTHINLSKEPAFWVITAILTYSVTVSPTLIFNLQSSFLGSVLHLSINAFAYFILHILFIKAYTCKVPK